MKILLEGSGLSKHYSGVVAVRDVSLTLHEGEVLGLIGPNGAGKTTLLNLVTGFVAPSTGRLLLRGESLVGRRSHAIARLGLTRTFQMPFLYEDVTVVENVRRAVSAARRESLSRQLVTRRGSGQSHREATERALALLDEVGLGRSKGEMAASSLPYGNRKLVSIAMAMASDPAVVCLDEPAAGLSGPEKEKVLRVVRRLNDRGVAVLLVEHDMNVITSTCHRIMVLDHGECIAEGKPDEVLRQSQVVAAYLGGGFYASAAS